eukprot:scaffold21677_cov51-Phaeocystis_antarctica.AAC.1
MAPRRPSPRSVQWAACVGAVSMMAAAWPYLVRVGVRLGVRVGVGVAVRVAVRVGVKLRVRVRVRARVRVRVRVRLGVVPADGRGAGRGQLEPPAGGQVECVKRVAPRLQPRVHL